MSTNVQDLTGVDRCPACRDNVTSQQATYVYARPYLCGMHTYLWDAADERAHKGSRCPHDPKPCQRCCT
jgi:hypothetical protein